MFRLGAMGETLLGGHDKYVINEHKHLVCRLPAKGYGLLEFDLTPERMAPIVDAGDAAMDAHLAQAIYGAQNQPVPAAAPA